MVVSLSAIVSGLEVTKSVTKFTWKMRGNVGSGGIKLRRESESEKNALQKSGRAVKVRAAWPFLTGPARR